MFYSNILHSNLHYVIVHPCFFLSFHNESSRNVKVADSSISFSLESNYWWEQFPIPRSWQNNCKIFFSSPKVRTTHSLVPLATIHFDGTISKKAEFHSCFLRVRGDTSWSSWTLLHPHKPWLGRWLGFLVDLEASGLLMCGFKEKVYDDWKFSQSNHDWL